MRQFLKNIDKTTIVFSLFIIIIITLFAYIFHIEKNMNSFAKESAKIVQLQLIDKELENFSLAINQFSNYDIIDNEEKKFEAIMQELQNYLKESKKENKKIIALLDSIDKIYKSKLDDIEYFKAQNASLINGSHFLFDLQVSIEKDPTLPMILKYRVNEVLFFLLRYTSSDYIDKKIILDLLDKIENDAKEYNNRLLHNFAVQSKILLETMSSLKEVSKEIHNSLLFAKIEALQEMLTQEYNSSIFQQTVLAVIIFLLMIGTLIFLIISHLQSLQTKKELYAFRFAIEHSDNTVVITDPQRHITYVNETFEKVTGYTFKEVKGLNPSVLKSGLQSEDFYKELNEKLQKGQKWEGQFINKRKDGSLYYEKASIVPVILDGKLISYLALKLDITEFVEQNKKLALAASVFENTEEAIIITDKNGKINSINSAFERIYGYTLKEIEGKTPKVLQSGKQNKIFYEELWAQLLNEGIWRGKLVNRTKNGAFIPIWTTIKAVKNEKGEILSYTAVQTDLREIESSQAKVDYLAFHDPLTGLYNRSNFEEYLKHALSIAKRNKTKLALLFIDLDRFKNINDSLGHDIGDKVLIEVAKRIENILRESDFIARWGGDEFVVILENLNSINDAAKVATSLIEVLQKPIVVGQHTLLTTASIGISLFPDNSSDAHTLIKYADSAMYLAKDEGKNNFKYYTKDLSRIMHKRLQIDMALHEALQKNEFYVVFQPQYRLASNTIAAAEALIRWESKDLGFIGPDVFIPIAEESGAIVPIGYFVFEESCKTLLELRKAGVNIDYIAVNVSSIQFKEPNLLEKFLLLVKKYNLTTSDIEIEITERFVMEQTSQNITLLQKFQDAGFKISIDDFGTGYSSMSYLKKLPINTLKIDKSFVDDIGENHSDNAIVEAIIVLARTLGYSTVAEGIETQQQENFLRNFGCDLGQGYLFSKPVKKQELIERFSTN